MYAGSFLCNTWLIHFVSAVNFIFTMDLLNFSFWSESCEETRFAIDYKGRKWTGYWSLVAALQRALDEGIPITSSDFWQNKDELTIEAIQHVFRSATDEQMPMLMERMACLEQAGNVLNEVEYSPLQCISCSKTDKYVYRSMTVA